MTSNYNADGYYAANGVPGGGGFCITPGGNSPGGTTYWNHGDWPNATQSAWSATVMWFANNFGPNGIAYTPPTSNGITVGVVPGATGGTGYGGVTLDTLDDTVTAEQIANDYVLGIVDSDHSDSDTGLVNGIQNFAMAYPGPWTLDPTQTSGTPQTGGTYKITLTAANHSTVPVSGLVISVSNVTNANGLASSYATNNGVISFTMTPAGSGFFGANFSSSDVASSNSVIYANGIPGYQWLIAPHAGSAKTTAFGNKTAAQTGNLQVFKQGNDTAYYSIAGAQFLVQGSGGDIGYLTVGTNGYSNEFKNIPTGQYTLTETTTPPHYMAAPSQTVTVTATTPTNPVTLVDFTGQNQDYIRPTRVYAQKKDAQSGAYLGGAVFEFRYDQFNGPYSSPSSYVQDLGTCTTTQPTSANPTGECSPPGNYTSGYPGAGPLMDLPGWYQVTEVKAPQNYYLNPATAVSYIYAAPVPVSQNTVTATFTDMALGSLQVLKTGNDTAYYPITGAVFTAVGPSGSSSPSTYTLTIGSNGKSNVVTDMQPGNYTVTETTTPPGYATAPPQIVKVNTGHATTEVSFTDSIKTSAIKIVKHDALSGQPLAGAVFSISYAPTPGGAYSQSVGTCTTGSSGTCEPNKPNDGTGLLPGDYQVTETAAPSGYTLASPAVQDVKALPGQTTTVTFSDPKMATITTTAITSSNIVPAYEHDVVVVSGYSATYKSTLTWELLGPVAPSSGSCVGLSWTNAPVFASGSMPITGNGTYELTAPNAVTEAGCYSWASAIAPSATQTGFSSPPGQPTETVKLVPTITTSISATSTSTPATLADHITAIGFGSNTNATLTWQILGPVTPNANGSCTGVNWSGAPVFATGTLNITGSGNYTTPASPVIQANGCYTYADSWNTAGYSTGFSTAGIPSETTAIAASAGVASAGVASAGAASAGLINTGRAFIEHSKPVLYTLFVLGLLLAAAGCFDLLRRRHNQHNHS
ncbi:MAG: MSCRAMM family protein [Acidimicrobiales bacterium]